MIEKKITISDIAAKAKVSKSTVSRVLNNNTPVNDQKRSVVLKAMQQLNYKPNALARGLAGGRSMTIGIVTQNIGSPFYDRVTQGIISRLSSTDYSPIFADGQWDPAREIEAIETLRDRQVDGLIMVGGNLTSAQLEEACGADPMILVARRLEGCLDRCVWVDNQSAAYKATKYLIEAGHTRIAHITGIKDHQDAIDRLAGYRMALAEAGIAYDPQLVIEGNFDSQSGVTGVESLLIRGVSFSAIFAANDEMAFGVRLALYRRGIRVPEDVSIIGFDNQPLSAFMTPPLTTVAQPALELGSAAARLLLTQLGQDEFETHEFKSEIVIRESVQRRR